MDNGSVLAVKVCQGHGVNFCGGALNAIKVRFLKGKGSVSHDVSLEPKIARSACSGFYGVVRADANDHDSRFTAGMQPTL